MKPRLPRLTTAAAAALLFGAASAFAARPEDDLRDVARVPVEVSRSVDVGRLDGDVRFTRAILVLPARDAAGLERFLESLQDPSSPDFRRWLTPEEFGRRFGAPEADVAALRAHLEANGLEVEDVPAGRTALLFSGRAAEVERAFATELREVFVDGAVRVANVRPARLPAGLARRTAGLLSLSSFPRRKALASRTPAYTDSSGRHVLAPADFATIYGIDALAAAGINGTGRKIAVLAQTNVTVADTRFFRQYFGLPANDPQIVLNGPDAGINGDEIEADLDIQWAGAVAPAAQVLLVVSKTTLPSYGVDLSALYAVNNNIADVLNLSYGACENDFVDSDTVFYTNIWAQAAAQGMTSFVSSGDSGADTCGPGRNDRVHPVRERPRLLAVCDVCRGDAVPRHVELRPPTGARRTTPSRRSPPRGRSPRACGTRAAPARGWRRQAAASASSSRGRPGRTLPAFPRERAAPCRTFRWPQPATRRTTSCSAARGARRVSRASTARPRLPPRSRASRPSSRRGRDRASAT